MSADDLYEDPEASPEVNDYEDAEISNNMPPAPYSPPAEQPSSDSVERDIYEDPDEDHEDYENMHDAEPPQFPTQEDALATVSQEGGQLYEDPDASSDGMPSLRQTNGNTVSEAKPSPPLPSESQAHLLPP